MNHKSVVLAHDAQPETLQYLLKAIKGDDVCYRCEGLRAEVGAAKLMLLMMSFISGFLCLRRFRARRSLERSMNHARHDMSLYAATRSVRPKVQCPLEAVVKDDWQDE